MMASPLNGAVGTMASSHHMPMPGTKPMLAAPFDSAALAGMASRLGLLGGLGEIDVDG